MKKYLSRKQVDELVLPVYIALDLARTGEFTLDNSYDALVFLLIAKQLASFYGDERLFEITVEAVEALCNMYESQPSKAEDIEKLERAVVAIDSILPRVKVDVWRAAFNKILEEKK